MKGILKLTLAFAITLFGISCSDDEPKVNPIIGNWVIDSFVIENVPSAFSSNEGQEFASLWGESKYTLSFTADNQYTRVISFSSDDLSEEGEWELDDDELTLDPDGTGLNIFEDFTVVKSEKTDLILKAEVVFGFIPDIYFDTVTQVYLDYLATLTEDQLDSINDELVQGVSVDLIYDFDLLND
ncbi:MAG: hypothetical protein ACJA08_002852 [Cyclobacteriaceae bacterium]|jgi:hypothetical protein